MARVMGATERLPKRGRNDYFNYDFVQDADVLEAVRNAMASVNLALFVSLEQYAREDNRTIAEFVITFADGDTGAIHPVSWAAEAQDKGDKGLNKAATAAVKYCLLKTFLIPTGDDDPDAGGDAPSKPRRQPRQQSDNRNRPLAPDVLKGKLHTTAANKPTTHQALATPGQKGLVTSKLNECFAPAEDADGKRHAVTDWLFGKTSAKELTMAEAGAVLDWLLDKDADEGTYDLHPKASQEAEAVYREAMKDADQSELELEEAPAE